MGGILDVDFPAAHPCGLGDSVKRIRLVICLATQGILFFNQSSKAIIVVRKLAVLSSIFTQKADLSRHAGQIELRHGLTFAFDSFCLAQADRIRL